MSRAPLAAELHALPYGPERSRAVYDLFMAGRTKAECARLTGLTPGQVGAAIRWCYRQGLPRKGRTGPEVSGDLTPEAAQATFEARGESAQAWSVSDRITTLDQLLAACAVDLSRWRVERYVINKYDQAAKGADGEVVVTPLFQVKAWLARRQDVTVEHVVERHLERLRAAAPRFGRARARLSRGEYLLIPSLYDAHFNKRSADGGYTLARAAAEFKAVADAIVARARALALPVERVLFPVGNDALHADNLAGDTTDGTRLETVDDQRDAIDALCDACEYAALRFLELAPVDIVAIESNHDRLSTFWLGKVLEAYFHRTPDVTVDAARAPNKYYVYGQTLIGLQHGDKIKPDALAVLMATEAPDAWARTRYRQWLRGHIHYAAGMYYPSTETHGVSVRVIPALCPPDQYHLLRGYVGGHRAAEALYYHREHGPAGTFPVFVDELAADRIAELAEVA